MEAIKTSFGRKIKRILHILNPLAGKGTAKKVRKHIKEADETYILKQQFWTVLNLAKF